MKHQIDINLLIDEYQKEMSLLQKEVLFLKAYTKQLEAVLEAVRPKEQPLPDIPSELIA